MVRAYTAEPCVLLRMTYARTTTITTAAIQKRHFLGWGRAVFAVVIIGLAFSQVM
jgi:hypothetical protein